MNRRELLKLCAAGAIAVPVSALTAGQMQSDLSHEDREETSFERVIRTQTIRCAYANFTPSFWIDPSTQKKQGIYYELTNLVGQYLGFKMDWTEEVGYGTIIEGFKTGRYDLFGGQLWPSSERAVHANFTDPLNYSHVWIWVRADDKRFETADDLNNSSVTFAIKDGDVVDSIAKTSFPRAKRISSMQLEDKSREFINVATGKADAMLAEIYLAEKFMKHNPKTLRRIPLPDPIRIYGNVLMFNNDDWRLKVMFDAALNEIRNTGVVEKIVEKYTGSHYTYLPPARPYELPED